MIGDTELNAGLSRRPTVIRPGKPSIRTTFQLLATLQNNIGTTSDNLEERARETILAWLAEKFPLPLPPTAPQGGSFDIEEHGQSMVCVAIPEEGIWTVRLNQPDSPFMGRSAVAGRFWVTDLALRRTGSTLSFGTRIQCASLGCADSPIVLTRPRVVKDLASQMTLLEMRPMNGEPWHLRSLDDLRDFERFLLNPLRVLPVILLTQPDRNRLRVNVTDYLLDPARLARDLIGLGHVATLPRDLGYHWTDLVGKPWSAFLGAVRTYMPGLDYDRDAPSMHPLTFAERILYWRHFDENGEHNGEEAFERFLSRRTKEYRATTNMNWGDCVFLPEAKPMQLAMARQQTHDDGLWKELSEAEIASLKQTVDGLRGEVNDWLETSAQAERERDFFKDANAQLRGRIAWLEKALTERGVETASIEESTPSDYDSIPDWASRRLAGKLVLHSRALRGLKKGEYEDISQVCESLILLATHYRNMRLGYEGAKEAFESRCSELELRLSGSITYERAGKEGDTYFVDFPAHSSRRHFVDLHLRKGNSFEPRYCMALYFFWDEDSQQVVVAWLPSHLQNRFS